MEYTKGEWKAQWHEITGTWNVIEQPGVGLIARCGSGKGYETNAHLIAAAPDLYEELVVADKVICELCKRLNPQHVTADYGKGCEWCQERESRLKALAKGGEKRK